MYLLSYQVLYVQPEVLRRHLACVIDRVSETGIGLHVEKSHSLAFEFWKWSVELVDPSIRYHVPVPGTVRTS